MLSNRTINDIADVNTLRRTQTGLARMLLPQEIDPATSRTRSATIRSARPSCGSRSSASSIARQQNGVTFLTPGAVPRRDPDPRQCADRLYEVDVKLFADGALLARTQTALEVVKVGFEQFVANAARDHGLLYGLATALMALLTGWFASVVFRKD